MPLSHFSTPAWSPFPSLRDQSGCSVAKSNYLRGMVWCRSIGFSYVWMTCVTILSAVGEFTGSFLGKWAISKQKNRIINVGLLPDGNLTWKVCKSAQKQKKQQNIGSWIQKASWGSKTNHYHWSTGIIRRYSPADSGLSHNLLQHTKSCMAKLLMIHDCGAKWTKYNPYTRAQKKQSTLLVGRINSEYSTLTWVPVHYFYRSFPFEELSAFYSMSDNRLSDPIARWLWIWSARLCSSKTNQTEADLIESGWKPPKIAGAVLVNQMIDRVSLMQLYKFR